MKTTKKIIRPVSKVIQYQKADFIRDINIKGKEKLADIEKKDDQVTFTLKADNDKLDVKRYEDDVKDLQDTITEINNRIESIQSSLQELSKLVIEVE